jgi:hypothetical protein
MGEHRLWLFENRVLRRIFEPKREKVHRGCRQLHNEELHHNVYSSPNVIHHEWFYSLLQAPTPSTTPLQWSLAFIFRFLICRVLTSCSALSSNLIAGRGGGGHHSLIVPSALVNVSFLQGICFICSRQMFQSPQPSCPQHSDYVGFIIYCSCYNLWFYQIRHLLFSLMGPHIVLSIFP